MNMQNQNEKSRRRYRHMKTENDNKKTSRASQTRSKTERPKVWSPPSLLDAPPAPDGYQHRWLRESSLGFDDTKNIHKRLRSGYELVRADDPIYKDIDLSTYAQYETGKYKGVIGQGGLVLARIPNEFAKQYMEYYEKQGRDNMEAVDNDLLKDQDKRMPINIDRQSRVLGGTKK